MIKVKFQIGGSTRRVGTMGNLLGNNKKKTRSLSLFYKKKTFRKSKNSDVKKYKRT